MADCNQVSTPATSEACEDSERLPDSVPYRGAVGSLLHLSGATRPDISFAASKAARNLENPTVEDWNSVVRISSCLRGTTKFSILHGRQNTSVKIYRDAVLLAVGD